MSQVQVAKLSSYINISPEDRDSVVVTKLSTYFVLRPGEGDEGDVVRDSWVYSQVITR